MGRNLPGRTALAILLLLPAALFAATGRAAGATAHASQEGPLPPAGILSARTRGTTGSRSLPYLSPAQGRAAPKAWSVSPDEAQWDRPEVKEWTARWKSPEGIAKLTASRARYAAFRADVEGIVRDSGIPWEFAFLPVVESNWRIEAVSRSGAAGPWQFLRASAVGRGLVVDAWRDERRDVWRSTEAAMAELAFYRRLFSDWLMAAASYNAGPTRMRRLKESGDYQGYWDLYDAGLVPPETRNYVPQVMAVAYLSAHAGRIGLPIRWEVPPRWTRIPLERSVPLDAFVAVASASGGEASLLRRAHGELHHPFTPPPGVPYSLKVPSGSVEKVESWLDGLDGDDVPERFWRYTVHSGDTLSGIADRYGIPLSELLGYNAHVASGLLRIGERLYIPGTGEEPADVEPDELPDWSGRYSVMPGDSLWSIARRFGITPERLSEANHRRIDGVLTAGSVLNVPMEGEEL